MQQKVIRYRPQEKLLDELINMLAGGSGLVEVNTRVRSDLALQRAFARKGCAEQSTISETFTACTQENVDEMRRALQCIYRRHSRAYRHDYDQDWQLLDIDLTGPPAGRQGEGVEKGYVPKHKGRRGRQLGRVLATWYEEVIVERLYAGKRQLNQGLQELVEATEAMLHLTQAKEKRTRTILRVDGGGGDDQSINWMLRRGYGVLVKLHSWQRAEKLAQSVSHW